jgi:putative acetyltransferase
MKRLETNRLILRDITLEDAYDMFEYACLEEVGPAAGWHPHKSLEVTKAIITSLATSNQVWAIEHKHIHKMIGTAGMDDSDRSEYPVMGIVLSPVYQHQGFAREALLEIIEHTFLTSSSDCITAFVYEHNTPSKKLLFSLGFIDTKNDKTVFDLNSKSITQHELCLYKEAFFKIKNV